MKRLILILAPAALFLFSCKSENIKEPEYREIQNVRITDVGLLQTTAGLDLVYYNPNDFGVTLSLQEEMYISTTCILAALALVIK